jgi:hypothetical protein
MGLVIKFCLVTIYKKLSSMHHYKYKISTFVTIGYKLIVLLGTHVHMYIGTVFQAMTSERPVFECTMWSMVQHPFFSGSQCLT